MYCIAKHYPSDPYRECSTCAEQENFFLGGVRIPGGATLFIKNVEYAYNCIFFQYHS